MSKDKLSKNSLIIIDGYGFVFRAYHVQPPLLSPDGTPVGALYGFTSMLLKLIKDFGPTKAVVVLDSGSKNFRHDIYKEYKANRPPAPDDLVVQLKLIREAAASLNFPVLEKIGFEADDIIATLATNATKNKQDAIIVSSDKDLMQLINSHVGMYDPVKARFVTLEDVEKKFCVTPDKVRDVQALMGDKSDNIPGVAGIGPKTAAQLINQFNDLEGIYSSIDQIKSENQRKKLITHKEDAFISYKLVGLDCSVDIDLPTEQLIWSPPSAETISSYLNKYGFKSLIKRASNTFGIETSLLQPNIVQTNDKKTAASNDTQVKDHETKYINSIEKLEDEIKIIENLGIVSTFIDTVDNKTLISLSYDIHAGKTVTCVVNLSQHENDNIFSSNQQPGENLSLFDQNNQNSNKTEDDIINSPYFPLITKILADSSIMKITHDVKSMMKKYKINNVESAQDLMLMQYALNPGANNKDIHELIATHCTTNYSTKHDIENLDESNSCVNISKHFFDLFSILKQELIDLNLYYLYRDIDLPICFILYDMEKEGIRIDQNHLSKLSAEFGHKAQELETKIINIAGEEFNVSSPSQLGVILFDKLGLPHGKTGTKSGAYSTNSEILENLSSEGHEIANYILEYRHYTKLKSTYTDTLPKLANLESSRIHTTYLQSYTTTGRLSSRDPNVQNIPIRSEAGNKVRECFVAKKGYKLISADYSQIELRILSHVADIEQLKKAFIENKDIHSQTASQIFGVNIDQIDSEMRRKAKAINFGIIYGISAFGLAKQINCSRADAANYIKKYFQEYPGIESYMSKTIDFARRSGYVENLLGRRCYLPNINSKNHSLKAYAERAAINAPLQGLNADIIKIAMISLNQILLSNNYKTKMLLQIHDELIFESPEDEVEQIMPLIKSTMEKSISLSIPTSVEINSGDNWRQIH